MDRAIVILLAASSLLGLAWGQIPIPKTRLGYVFNGALATAPISLDIHMGPLCPDSRDTLPVAKEVALHYGANTLRLTLHMFPLPYHMYAFHTAIGAKAVLKLRSVGDAYKWFDMIYENLDDFSNDATMSMTTTQVLEAMAEYASKIGIDRKQFLDTMAEEELDGETRGAWKYSCSRAVTGTPTYFLNDVPIAADPTWTLTDWMKVIDPLLAPEEIEDGKSNTTCPIFEPKCEYLPGKVECCKKGEACIPNVGCRCSEEEGEDCEGEQKACPSDTQECDYMPGKSECCTKGEACIPNVGCRCSGNDCEGEQKEISSEVEHETSSEVGKKEEFDFETPNKAVNKEEQEFEEPSETESKEEPKVLPEEADEDISEFIVKPIV